jgi:type IV secretory pathway TrbL component
MNNSTTILKDLLLITNPKVLGLSEYLNNAALLFVLPAFYIGMIVEYFTNFDFKSVAKRSVIAFLAIKLLVPIHVEAVDTSLKVSSELLKKYSPQNKFLTAYENAKGETAQVKDGVWGKLTSIVRMVVDDPIVMIIFLLSYVAFFLLTQLYSLVYHLAIAMFGLCAILSILPITSKSLTGAVKTSLWCIIMPFVVTIVLALIGDSDAFFKTYSGGIVQNLESLIQLLVMTIILLLTPLITTKIMNDSGVSGIAENIGQMAAMTTLIGGASMASKFIGSNSKLIGGALHNSTSKPLINKVKGSVSKKAADIAESKGIGASVNTLTNKSSFGKIKEGIKDFKDGVKKTTMPEKFVMGTDALLNRRENSLAKLGRSDDLKNSIKPLESRPGIKVNEAQNKKPEKVVLPLGSYKTQARSFLAQNDLKKAEFNSKTRNPVEGHFLNSRNRQNQISKSFNKPTSTQLGNEKTKLEPTIKKMSNSRKRDFKGNGINSMQNA